MRLFDVYNTAEWAPFACEWIVETVKKNENGEFPTIRNHFRFFLLLSFLCVYLDRKGCLPYSQCIILRTI
jgi:hypothetical protein